MLSDLKACRSRVGLATLLDIQASELSYVLYKMPDALKYTSFCISKKNGGTRKILSPSRRLKWIQRKLLGLLYECEDDIASSSGRTPNLHLGFRRGVNIYDNARVHRGKRFVFNADISDFFDQYNFGRVRGFFIRDRDFGLDPVVATVIAQIVCFDNVLPQGSPTSPHVANLLSQFFDTRMARFLQPRRCAYSRYADDVSISTNLYEFPADVAKRVADNVQGWAVAPELEAIFTRASLPINPAKTRMSYFNGRQLVTGLVVNERPNVTREFYLSTRSMCDRLFKTGHLDIPLLTPSFANNCPHDVDQTPPVVDPLKVIEGRLSHIYYIRDKADTRTIQEKQDSPTQFWTMHQDFFLFKYFFANRKAVLLTEGPSDIFYIRSAILNNKSALPGLKLTTPTGSQLIPSFFRFNTVAAEVMGLTGGAGNIKRFLYLYHKQAERFNKALRVNPVIIVVDNDSGGSDVIAMINGIYKTDISLADPQMVHKIIDGLILVKTPHVGSRTNTCVEDLLPNSIRSVILNGKTFSNAKKFDTSKHFGKMALGSYVQQNAPDLDLSGLDTFIQAINDAVTL